jgi:hypothetical protein
MGFFGRKKKQRKTVHFNLEATVELSDDCLYEGTACIDDEWWGDEEGASFQARDKRLAELMATTRLTPDELEREHGESSRGMELQFRENAIVIVARKTNSYNAVRSLQQLFARKEKKKPDEDAKSIARAYAVCCEGAVTDAARLGQADAKFVQENVINEPELKRISQMHKSLPPNSRSSMKKEPELALPKKKKFFSLRRQ